MSIISLAVATTAFGYVTYSWFRFQKSQDLNVMSVSVEKGLTYSLKYFVENDEEGYPSPSFSPTDVDVTVSNYGTQFQYVSPGFHETINPLKLPYYRLTYALEIYAEAAEVAQTIDVVLTSFDAPASPYYYDVDSEEAISLASAIDIYTTVIDGDLSDAEKTSLASAFVASATPGSDYFDGAEGSETIATSALEPNAVDQTRIVLFTIEFSGHPSTFYTFDHESDGLSYFDKSTSGNSNVYQGLHFTINNIMIAKSTNA